MGGNYGKTTGKWWFDGNLWDLPSGKQSHNYGKSPNFTGKTHLKWQFSIAILNHP